jgi:hypothetical protein
MSNLQCNLLILVKNLFNDPAANANAVFDFAAMFTRLCGRGYVKMLKGQLLKIVVVVFVDVVFAPPVFVHKLQVIESWTIII